ELARDFGGSVHSIVLDAVDGHIERLKAKQAYDKRAMQAFQDYRETGLHITLNEFADWVDGLGGNGSKDMPECRK
ncbi:TPA: hypothetical protein ACFM5S_002125, partial [Neisseria meningitidis]